MFRQIRRLLQRVLVLPSGPPEIPLGEHPEVFRASTKHLRYLVTLWALRSTLLAVVLAVSLGGTAIAVARSGRDGWVLWLLLAIALGVAVGQGLFGYAVIRLDWEMRWYVLTDRSLRIREGITSIREVTLTLVNVQELKVSQGPLQRLLGIMDLVVDTAGGGGAVATAAGSVHGHQGVLRGVAADNTLRQKIEARSLKGRGRGLGEPDDRAVHGDDHAVDHGDQSGAFLTALQEVRDEARALRRASERR